MENTLKIKCPAKINLTLEILNKRDDGFHNIKSIMQLISLYDYLTITMQKSSSNRIILSGNSNEIPYDEKNLVYKAIKLYLEEANITDLSLNVYIEKNIPISAGLAGGSTDAAGVIWGLNYLLKIFDSSKINDVATAYGNLETDFIMSNGKLTTTSGNVYNNFITCVFALFVDK